MAEQMSTDEQLAMSLMDMVQDLMPSTLTERREEGVSEAGYLVSLAAEGYAGAYDGATMLATGLAASRFIDTLDHRRMKGVIMELAIQCAVLMGAGNHGR